MRTEQEIRDHIEVADQRFIKLLQGRKAGVITKGEFTKLYSNTWEEEVALYWALGMERKDAAVLVCSKFIGMRMSDELKK